MDGTLPGFAALLPCYPATLCSSAASVARSVALKFAAIRSSCSCTKACIFLSAPDPARVSHTPLTRRSSALARRSTQVRVVSLSRMPTMVERSSCTARAKSV